MPKLVIVVDRDDDLGQKAGIRGPVLGREDVVRAAVALGTRDPEDSDVNSFLAAVSVADELRSMGEEAEVAILTGHPDVGVKSDLEISRQLEEVLSRTGAREVIFVSDGAEDEFVLPIIQSRARVVHVRRVVVRQAQELESTYYTIKKALEDVNFLRRVLTPLAIIFLAYSLTAITGMFVLYITGRGSISPANLSISVILLALGSYFIFKTHDVKGMLSQLLEKAGHPRPSTVLRLIALLLAAFSLIFSSYIASTYERPLQAIYSGVLWVIPFAAGAVALWVAGDRVLLLSQGKEVSWKEVFSILLLGLFAFSIVSIMGYVLDLQVPLPLFVNALLLAFSVVSLIVIAR